MPLTSNLPATTRPTIKHIAHECGVSVATVSYVINGKHTLKPATREKVMRAMEEMNYHPNAVARGLQSKRVHTLGVLFGAPNAIDFIDHSYVTKLLHGVIRCARAEGFDITFFTTPWQNAATSAPPLADGRTDGVIAIAPRVGSDILQGLASLRIPHVAISAVPQENLANVDVDNFAGTKMATQHLLDLGHRRIALFNGNDDLASHAPRRAGFLSALKNANIEPCAAWLHDSNFDGESAFGPARALLQSADRPTAICAGNDHIALAILEAARSLDIAVPDELSVIGFDDIPEANTASPPLTTIRQPFAQIGETTTQLLIEALREPQSQNRTTHLIRPELVIRETTAKPAAQRA